MNNVLDIVYWIPLLPLLGCIINGLGRKSLSKGAIGVIGSGVILASFVLSLWAFFQVRAGNVHTAEYFPFINVGNLKIPFAFQIDQLSAIWLLVITGVGFLIHVYSTSYMHDEKPEHFGRYFAYLNLFVFSMLLLVMGANFVIMFIGWEGVGLCSYLLIGFWFKKKEYSKAANKAFIMNRIGDLAFLIALFMLINKLGTTTFSEIFTSASLAKLSGREITVITLLLFVGATGKSAQIPLYTWLPDAMAGPTPVSALIHAATMVTAGIYMIARANLLFSMAPATLNVIAIIGIATALLAATIALKQNDIKKVLAYSTVSQLGYMFLALGSGAYVAAVFHVMTHAFFKALLFLGSGSVIHAMGGEQDMRRMGGLSKYMKVTNITFLLGCLAIAGIPGFSGFFSKDEILAGAFAKSPVLYALGLLGALLTAFYMFRLYATTFKGNFRGTQEQEHHLHESPAAITVPLIVLAILSVVGGFVGVPGFIAQGAHALSDFLKPVFKDSYALLPAHEVSHSMEWTLAGVSSLLVIVVVVIAWSRFAKKPDLQPATGLGKVLENKWYVDELYDTIIVRPLNALGSFLSNVVDRKVVDGVVNGVGRLVSYGGRQLRWLQSGQTGSYILMMVLGMVLIFIVQFFLRK
ncbi:NADH-quinone oxidoreductase subunit L [Niabella drilacis]|uniref:NADH-quinone oxidoreductase subunit L n=1 Tax=Niabella drilacis (strain DSM 25811 / CCM 8410 / CCUG 62505 / LMG 26954 / E90) TaxID=1285928 RepID=A0A1G6VJB3_NIADE|nr:NADH-quinone oxidoreductase subunit L [Niabella drilacis]SDD53730.1 NADH-quinone oxidoreductase subunit L [Niabella drilacis]